MLYLLKNITSQFADYIVYYIANADNGSIRIFCNDAVGKFAIDNVSVKQVDPNDRWELYGESEFTQQGVRIYSSSGAYSAVNQNNVLIVGKQYKVTFDVISTNGSNLANGGGTITYNTSTTGSKKFIITADETIFQLKRLSGATDVTVNNISVVEVQGDRPRLSYDITNGVVEDKPHLLLENSSTNLVLFSEDFSNSSWTNIGLAVDNVNLVTSPDGTKNAQKITAEAGGFRLIRPAASIGGTSQTFSIFVKNVNASNFYLRTSVGFSYYNFASKTTTGGNITATEFGNGWIRLSVRPPHNAYKQFGIGTDESTGGTAEVGNSVYVWGMQVEAGSIATSYIPTAGTTITRAAETCNNSKPSVNSTEGVFYAEIQALASDSTAKVITISDGTTNNRVIISYSTANQIRIKYRNSSSNIFDQPNSSTITDFHKIAVKWKVNDFSFYLDGSQVASSTSGSVMSANTLTTASFDDGAGGFDFYGKVKGLAVYNEALSESQLMQLTGVTASSIYNNFVTRTASFTVEALNEVKKVIDNL
jgi:hypothetical protein